MSEDPSDQLGQSIGAYGLKGAGAVGLYWLAGPTLKAVGKAFGDWTDWRLRNLLHLGEKIEARRTSEDDDEGIVHPKVLHEIFERGSWIDDNVAQEYLAGILISARSKDGSDEHAAYLTSIVAGMTSAQIRMHHAIYAALKSVGEFGSGLQLTESRRSLSVYMPMRDVIEILGPDGFDRSLFVIDALARLQLIGVEYGVGSGNLLNQHFAQEIQEAGVHVLPTTLGADIFLRAYGIVPINGNELLRELNLPTLETEMPTAPNALVGPMIG